MQNRAGQRTVLALPARPGQTTPMTVRVLYFAALRDLVRAGEELVELEGTRPSVSDLLRVLAQRHPELSGRLSSIRVAQNETFVELDTALSDADVIALIPPVAGG